MLTIYGVPFSVHTRKVIVAAIEKDLEHRVEPVIPFFPPEGWAKLSPTGKIPVIAHGGFVLQDSAAICAYIERLAPAPSLYPADAKEFGQTIWFEQYAGTLFRDVVHGLFLNKVIRPKILKQPGDPAAVERTLAEAAPPVFSYLDAAAAGGYLAAGRFTLADLAVMSNLINFNYLGYRIDPALFPMLAAYFGKHLRQPSLGKALREERAVAEATGLDSSFLDETAAAG